VAAFREYVITVCLTLALHPFHSTLLRAAVVLSEQSLLSRVPATHSGCACRFCGLACLPVVYLWSFIYYPGYLMRDRHRIKVYFVFQVVGIYYWWTVISSHFINAFLLSFGVSNGYVVISAGFSPSAWYEVAICLAFINWINCMMGSLGSLMGLFGGKFKVEEPVVVEGTIKPEPAAGGKPTAEVENPL
jgi:hypothetical protein